MGNDKHSVKFRILDGVILLSGLIIISFLIKIQLLDPFYSAKANATTLNQKTIYPSRGLFYDREGKLLVINYPAYDLYVTYNAVDKKMDTARFCQLIEIDKSQFLEFMTKDWSSGRFSKSIPFVFMKNISSTIFHKFQENLFLFPGFYAELRSIREYPVNCGANFLGYISEVTQNDINQSEGLYKPGDYIGSAGIEKKYEQYIRGEKGVHFVMKDNLGTEVGPYLNGSLDKHAAAGSDIVMSIDLDLQLYAESLMVHKVGSIVAIEPSTGEILTLATSPNYNPNLLSIHHDRGRAYANLLRDTLKPLFDRSASAKYPPGSIFKPIMALIALQDGIINENTPHACNRGYFYKTIKVGCHGHPAPFNIQTALQHSCNAYFIETFRDYIDQKGFNKPQYGLDKLVDYLHAFGLGKPLYTDVQSETAGFIPSSEYYSRIYKTDQWRSPYIMSIGIGQGELQLTTIQMANLAAIIANRGYYITPHLIKGFIKEQKEVSSNLFTRYKVPIDAKYFPPVIEGMELAVKAGTATKAFNPELSICGKTGTSQNPHGEDHSVFFAFSPKYDPKIAIAVYVENAGWGGDVAAPIASLVIEKYLNKNIKRKDLQDRMMNKDLLNKKVKRAKRDSLQLGEYSEENETDISE
ncbi:MAG TPA: penicillin-binding transpeptidase domain-containing protein [Saprospiraceae bacterium]|nr:penicillin-binding transpeptidase domain-containing protein [Saprospiraceae bacterium]